MGYAQFLFFATILCLCSCYEPKEGCLDINAVNFDASADENCCCEYPALKVSVLHRFDSLVWQTDSVYVNALDLPFRLRNAAFYCSSFALEQNGVVFGVEDTLTLKTYPVSGADTTYTRFSDDFLLLRRSPTEYSVGQFPYGGDFQRILFYLGLPDSAKAVIPSQAPAGHPLQLQAENLWLGQDTSYANLFLVVQTDTTAGAIPDTLYFTRLDFDRIMIKESRNFTRQTGFDFKLKLTINYAAMFRDVDWQNGDKNAWKSKIIANLPLSFNVSQ